MKRNFYTLLLMLTMVICLSLTACGTASENGTTAQAAEKEATTQAAEKETTAQAAEKEATTQAAEKETTAQAAEKETTTQATKNTEIPTTAIPETTEPEGYSTDASITEAVTEPTEEITTEITTTAPDDGILKKVTVRTDEVGIYSVIIELNDSAADKAVIEMVYTGATGTAEEGSIVNTYRIEYYKDSTGKYEVSTFYNGNVDRNLHQQDSIKVDNTFGAGTRAADVVITYTPDGGESEEIFRGLAKDYQ